MRGKVNCFSVKGLSVRITPAYAGKRKLDFTSSFIFWDHPRLCGEKFEHIELGISILGSPPPMRGKVYGKSDY